jgi:hypothetical protein
MGSGLMYFCGRITPRGIPIARKSTRIDVTANARMRSSTFLRRFSGLPSGESLLSERDFVDDGDPPSPSRIYGFARSFTTIVAFGIDRYGVPFFSLASSGGSRYCVGVSLRWYVERRWLGGGIVRPYAFAMLRGDGGGGLGKMESGIEGGREDIFGFEAMRCWISAGEDLVMLKVGREVGLFAFLTGEATLRIVGLARDTTRRVGVCIAVSCHSCSHNPG